MADSNKTSENRKPQTQEVKMSGKEKSVNSNEIRKENLVPVPVECTPITAEDFLFKCRKKNSDGRSSFRQDTDDFSRLEVKGMTLDGENLDNINADFSNFTDCTFINCDLESASFRHTALLNVKLIRCHLRGAEFHFANVENLQLEECDADGLELNFASGSLSAVHTGMRRWELPMSRLTVTLTDCSAACFECNDAELALTASSSDFNRSEFNGTKITGSVSRCSFRNGEFNGADVQELTRTDCRFDNIENENAIGFNVYSDEEEDNEESFLNNVDYDDETLFGDDDGNNNNDLIADMKLISREMEKWNR